MIDEEELLTLLADMESFRVERTTSAGDTQKFCEAICAFANDMAGAHLPGFLLIGADDKTGEPAGLRVTDGLLQLLAGLSGDGNILPPPAMMAYKVTL
jgi:ATP-dependent DNA helicase RecG